MAPSPEAKQVPSDLDLIVEFEGSATYDRNIGLKLPLEDVLGCPVDLVTSRAIKP